MSNRREEFFTELAALMEKHNVTMDVREEWSGYSCSADGIDFDFDHTDKDPSDTVELYGTTYITPETIAKLAKEYGK